MNPDPATGPGQADTHAQLFAQLVMQDASMALMFMGRAPHPDTGRLVKDLEAAQMFIAHLEMLEAKTRGNLDKDEAALLKQTLMTTRLAFVESVEEGGALPEGGKPGPAATAAEPAVADTVTSEADPSAAATAEAED